MKSSSMSLWCLFHYCVDMRGVTEIFLCIQSFPWPLSTLQTFSPDLSPSVPCQQWPRPLGPLVTPAHVLSLLSPNSLLLSMAFMSTTNKDWLKTQKEQKDLVVSPSFFNLFVGVLLNRTLATISTEKVTFFKGNVICWKRSNLKT